MKQLLILLLSISFTIFYSFDSLAENKNTIIKFEKPDSNLWKIENDEDNKDLGPEHYTFKKNEKIELNIVPITDDLFSQIKSKGKKQFIKDTMEGKNLINNLFGVGKSKIISTKWIDSNDKEILELCVQQKIEKDTIESFEKYFIFPSKALHIEIRYSKDIDNKQIEEAKNSLLNYKVENL